MRLQFHIAVISIAAFLTLAAYATESVHHVAFPAPLPPVQGRVNMTEQQAAHALLFAFNVGR